MLGKILTPLTTANSFGVATRYLTTMATTVVALLGGLGYLSDEQVEGFQVVDCRTCGGLLKPDVVFFGENVPRPRVDECFALVAGAGALVVLGSSLTVRSGLRFADKAAALGIPIAIVNQGPTGADADATVRLDAPLGRTLTDLTTALAAIPAIPAIPCQAAHEPAFHQER